MMGIDWYAQKSHGIAMILCTSSGTRQHSRHAKRKFCWLNINFVDRLSLTLIFADTSAHAHYAVYSQDYSVV